MSTANSDTIYFSAGIIKRTIAFLMDLIIAYLPAFVMMFVFTGNITHKAPLFYPSPIIGATTIGMTLPFEVNDALNTENGIYIFKSKEDTGAISAPRENRNVHVWATACRALSVLSVVFYAGYAAFCTVLYEGKTVGKRLMGIRVISLDEDKKLSKVLIIREVIGKVLINSIPIVPIVSIFTILFTRKHLAVHDMIAKTRVVE